MSDEELKRLGNKGSDALEKTSGKKVADKSKIIFLFKQGQSNTIESRYELFDESKNGKYFVMLKGMREMIYKTFKTQMPNLKIDTLSGDVEVDGLKFQNYQITVSYPNDDKMNIIFYTRLFNNKLFNLNMTYLDQESEKLMKEAWFNSKFKR